MNKLLTASLSVLLVLAVHCATHSAKAQIKPSIQAQACTEPSFVRGYDDKGNAICGRVTGCPYGDSIPADSPECAPNIPDCALGHDKFGNCIQAPLDPIVDASTVMEFGK